MFADPELRGLRTDGSRTDNGNLALLGWSRHDEAEFVRMYGMNTVTTRFSVVVR